MATSSASLIQVDPSGYQIGFFVCGTCSTYVALNQNCFQSFTPAGYEAVGFDKVVNVDVRTEFVIYKTEDDDRCFYYGDNTRFYHLYCKLCKTHIGWKVAEVNAVGDPQITDAGKFVLKRYIITGFQIIKLVEGKGNESSTNTFKNDEDNENGFAADTLENGGDNGDGLAKTLENDGDNGNGPANTLENDGDNGNGPAKTLENDGDDGNGPAKTLENVGDDGNGPAKTLENGGDDGNGPANTLENDGDDENGFDNGNGLADTFENSRE